MAVAGEAGDGGRLTCRDADIRLRASGVKSSGGEAAQLHAVGCLELMFACERASWAAIGSILSPWSVDPQLARRTFDWSGDARDLRRPCRSGEGASEGLAGPRFPAFKSPFHRRPKFVRPRHNREAGGNHRQGLLLVC